MVDQEDSAFSHDSKFRSYSDDVTTVLQSFDRAKEWADLIKCLVRLDKVWDRYPKFPVIPAKLTVAKRLAQCLNPALPSGVHLKALETYEILFARMGMERIARDVSIYSAGIFPLFQNASTQPQILHIYEKYYLILGQNILPCLSGLVLSLLPGLDETGTELADKVMKLLDEICSATQLTAFYHAIWKSLLITPYARLPALYYLNERLPKDASKINTENALTILTPMIPEKDRLVAEGLVRSLKDSNALVQRAALELLANHFRMDRHIWNEEVCSTVVSAALLVVTRKDTSLNRRLYTWLLGNTDGTGTQYFIANSKGPTVRAVKSIFGNTSDVVQPYRVLEYLLDRDDISPSLAPDILPDIFQSLYRNRDGPSAHNVIHSVTGLLNRLPQPLVWEHITDLVKVPEIGLVEAFLDILVVSEAHTIPLLNMLYHLTLVSPNFVSSPELLLQASQLALKIVGKIHHHSVADIPEINDSEKTPSILLLTLEAHANFYVGLVEQVEKLTSAPSEFLLKTVDNASHMLVTLLRAAHYPLPPTLDGETIPAWLQAVMTCCTIDHPRIACVGIRTFVGFFAKQHQSLHSSTSSLPTPNHNSTTSSLIRFLAIPSTSLSLRTTVARRLWQLLQPSCSDVHFEVAQLFSQVREVDEDVCIGVIAEAMLSSHLHHRVDAYQRFSLLWSLTSDLGTTYRPFPSKNLFLMLDSLHDDQPMIRLTGRTWLADSINKAERILDPLLSILLDRTTIRINNKYQTMYDARRVIYVFKVLKAIIECDFQLFMIHVVEKPVSREIMSLHEAQSNALGGGAFPEGAPEFLCIIVNNYIDLLVLTALRFIQGVVPETLATRDFEVDNSVVQIAATEFLQYLLVKITDDTKAADLAANIQESVLQSLAQAVSSADIALQVHLLTLLRTVVSLDSSSSSTSGFSFETLTPAITLSPMFLQTLVVGLIQPSTNNIRFYWLEFITSCLPRIGQSEQLPAIVAPVVRCLCSLLDSYERSPFDNKSARDIHVVLKSLMVVFNFCVFDPPLPLVKSPEESKGSLGARIFADFVKDVFTGEIEAATTKTPMGAARDALLTEAPLVVGSLLKVWGPPKGSAIREEHVHNKYAIQDQVIHLLEPLALKTPQCFLSALLDVWQSTVQDGGLSSTQKVALEVLTTLSTAKEEAVLGSLASLLAQMHSADRQRTSKAPNPKVELKIFSIFVRRIFSDSKGGATAPTSQGSGNWSKVRQNRRDLQEIGQRIVESCFMIASKSFSAIASAYPVPLSTDARAVSPPPDSNATGDHSYTHASIMPTPPQDTRNPDSLATLKREASRMKSNVSKSALSQLAEHMAALLDAIFDDKEKLVALLTSSLHHVVPYLRTRNASEHSYYVMALLASLCDYQYSLRAWRKDVLDMFMDSEFFKMDLRALNKSTRVINSLMQHDRTAFTDLMRTLSKSLGSQASMMFTSREQENLQRARHLKRLAFVIWSGTNDQYIAALPNIQERLVESLKITSASVLHVQVFLCLRVLLLRISPASLRGLWPVILTEMMDILSREDVDSMLVLAACKFLDFVMVIPSTAEAFNLYQWIFLTDKFDGYESSNQTAFAPLVEQLISRGQPLANPLSTSQLAPAANSALPRRPVILQRTTVDSGANNPAAFTSFKNTLARFSAAVYQNNLAPTAPDFEYIDFVLAADFCELEAIEVAPPTVPSPLFELEYDTPDNELPSPKPRHADRNGLTITPPSQQQPIPITASSATTPRSTSPTATSPPTTASPTATPPAMASPTATTTPTAPFQPINATEPPSNSEFVHDL